MGENGGPAPATENRINSIPTVRVTAAQARKFSFELIILIEFDGFSGDNLQCAICMDDFKENDEAKRLPCSHHFHEDCISRWLRMVSREKSPRSFDSLICLLKFSMEHVRHVV